MPAKEAQDGSGDIVEQQAAHIVRITNHVFWEGNYLNKDKEFTAMFVYKLQAAS